MVKLTNENFMKAREYIFANGDDITKAWFCYHFEGGDVEAFNGCVVELSTRKRWLRRA